MDCGLLENISSFKRVDSWVNYVIIDRRPEEQYSSTFETKICKNYSGASPQIYKIDCLCI